MPDTPSPSKRDTLATNDPVKKDEELTELLRELSGIQTRKVTTDLVNHLTTLVPSTRAEEKEQKYDKFQLGTVLVRDDFQVYDTLISCRDILLEMRNDALKEHADKQILEQIDYYDLSFKRFCDLMADMSLYEVMLKARSLTGDDDILIFIDSKTGAIGELSRKICIEKGMISISTDSSGKEKVNEAATDKRDKDDLINMIKGVLP